MSMKSDLDVPILQVNTPQFHRFSALYIIIYDQN